MRLGAGGVDLTVLGVDLGAVGVDLDSLGADLDGAGVDMDAWTSRIRQIWLKPPGSLDPVVGSEPALVSETFARRFEVLEGGTVELDTPNGKKLISPVGIFIAKQ